MARKSPERCRSGDHRRNPWQICHVAPSGCADVPPDRSALMFDEAAVRQLSEADQHRLMRLLVRLESERLPTLDRGSPRRETGLVVIVSCCVLLAAWTGWLAA